MTLPSSRKRDKAPGSEAVKCTLKIFFPFFQRQEGYSGHISPLPETLFLPLLHLDTVM